MFNDVGYQLRVVWACAKKDFQAALTDRLFTVLSLLVPVNLLILMSLFVLAGSNAPTDMVMEDQGPYAQAFYQAMSQAHSFRLQIASSAEAESLITAGQIVAVVTIPADFDAKVQKNQPVQVGVKINNLNTDFTDDIRRAIPLSITSFYAKAFPNLVSVSVQEHDLYIHDTDYVPYLGVSILVIALMMGGLLQSGTAAAKEWENQTIKELLALACQSLGHYGRKNARFIYRQSGINHNRFVGADRLCWRRPRKLGRGVGLYLAQFGNFQHCRNAAGNSN